MSIPPLAATTTAAALATRLRQEIDQGRWQAGELLRQEQLASEFGVSR
ncbi:MAG: GntR family transcriptional regulator, partial [Bosea sp.]|nr:GntR family transcriptional regulator [Bosea sp. (in: a-proteobacteria)]